MLQGLSGLEFFFVCEIAESVNEDLEHVSLLVQIRSITAIV